MKKQMKKKQEKTEEKEPETKEQKLFRLKDLIEKHFDSSMKIKEEMRKIVLSLDWGIESKGRAINKINETDFFGLDKIVVSSLNCLNRPTFEVSFKPTVESNFLGRYF